MRFILILLALAILILPVMAANTNLIRPDEINNSQPFPSITMDEAANISIDGGFIKNLQSDGIFNPLAYGAIADDATDDAEAIQDAADAAIAAGGGVVFFPPGEFIINSSQYGGGYNDSILIKPHSNVYFIGSGKGVTRLKVGDNYRQQYRGCCPIFEGDTGAVVDRWGISDMTIDFNGQNNYVQSGWKESEFSAIGAMSASNVTFENLVLENCSGNNVIYATGAESNCSNAYIRDCEIRNSGNDIAGNTLNDFSAMYIGVENTLVENCIIEGSSEFVQENAAAIEMHSPNSAARNNIIKNYRNGIYINNDIASNSSAYDWMDASHNTIIGSAYHGISTWMLGSKNMSNVITSGNRISMAECTESPTAYGICHTFEGGATYAEGTTDNFIATDNIISYPAPADVDLSLSNSYGICVSHANNTTISRNHIINALVVGAQCNIDDAGGSFICDGNEIRNAGVSDNSTLVYQSAVILLSNKNTSACVIADNSIISPVMANSPAIYLYSSAGYGINAKIRSNWVQGFSRDVWPDVPAGSAIIAEDRGAAAPASGCYSIGSIRWNTAPAAAGSLLWACTTDGSPGSWKPCNLTS